MLMCMYMKWMDTTKTIDHENLINVEKEGSVRRHLQHFAATWRGLRAVMPEMEHAGRGG